MELSRGEGETSEKVGKKPVAPPHPAEPGQGSTCPAACSPGPDSTHCFKAFGTATGPLCLLGTHSRKRLALGPWLLSTICRVPFSASESEGALCVNNRVTCGRIQQVILTTRLIFLMNQLQQCSFGNSILLTK